MTDQLIIWLVQQSPTVVVMGMWIYSLQNRYSKIQEEKSKSEQEKAELAKEVIKLTVSYDFKLDRDQARDQEIKVILTEIREAIIRWQK